MPSAVPSQTIPMFCYTAGIDMRGVSVNGWIGVADGACATSRGALPLRVADLRALRPDGGRIAAAAPADSVFFERVAIENVSWRDAAKLVPGRLDLSLPLPIERCAVMAIPATGSKAPLFMAFAMPVESCMRRVDAVESECGCRPEALVPAAAALWRAVVAAGITDAMALHVSGATATLVAVEGGVIAGVATARAADEALIVRDALLLAGRFANRCGRMVVAGPDASPDLVARLGSALSPSGIAVEMAASPGAFLAQGLASMASDICRDGGFLREDLAHPAATRRRWRSVAATSVLAAALSIAALALSAWRLRSAIAERDRRETTLGAMAAEVAGMPIQQKGRAAVERAKSLSDWMNPVIESFAKEHPIDILPAMLDAASERGATFSSVRYEGEILSLRGIARDTADVNALRRIAEKASFKVDADVAKASAGIGFGLRIADADDGGAR